MRSNSRDHVESDLHMEVRFFIQHEHPILYAHRFNSIYIDPILYEYKPCRVGST